MMVQPQAQTIGDVLDRAFDLYKKHFVLLVSVSGVLFVPARLLMGWMVIQLGFADGGFEAESTRVQMEQIIGALGVIFAALMGFMLLLCIECGAIASATSDCYFGHPTSVVNTYRKILRRVWPLVGAWICVSAILAVAYIVFGVGAAVISGMGIAAFSSFGPEVVQSASIVVLIIIVFVILFVLAGIFVAVGAFVTPLVIVEGTGPIAAIRRNIHLASGNVRRLSFAVIGSYFFVAALDSALGYTLTFGLSSAIFSWLHVSKPVHNIFELVVTSGVGAILHPFTMIALTLFYFDQRVRNDGLDIAIAIQNVEALIALDMKPQEQIA